MKRIIGIGFCMALLTVLAQTASAQSSATYELSWWTIDGGGASFVQSNRFTLGGTIGQPDASNELVSARFALRAGFWFPPEGCVPTGGDATGDGCIDDADLLEVLFNFGATGQNAADVNCDGIVDDADLLEVLFNFGSGC